MIAKRQSRCEQILISSSSIHSNLKDLADGSKEDVSASVEDLTTVDDKHEMRTFDARDVESNIMNEKRVCHKILCLFVLSCVYF